MRIAYVFSCIKRVAGRIVVRILVHRWSACAVLIQPELPVVHAVLRLLGAIALDGRLKAVVGAGFRAGCIILPIG